MTKAVSVSHLMPAVVLLLALSTFNSLVVAGELPATDEAFYAISVQNIDEAIAWYSEHLGFKLKSQGGNNERKGALLARQGVLLELGEFAGAMARDPELESHEIYGIFKLGFTTAHLDETYQALEQSGVEIFFPIVAASDGTRTFGVKDLEGNIIQFFGK